MRDFFAPLTSLEIYQGCRTPSDRSEFSESSSEPILSPCSSARESYEGLRTPDWLELSVRSTDNERVVDVASDTSGSSERRRSSIYIGSNYNKIDQGGFRFTVSEIYRATRNFSPTYKIGLGGFGTVFKGRLDDGTYVAVKRIKKALNDKHLREEFRSEVQTLARIDHLNLVKFLGYSEDEDERTIVFEYGPNGTLREHLDGLYGTILDLAARLDVAIDVAHAVSYLRAYKGCAIHRNITSSNILLTENFRAKLVNLGFAHSLENDAAYSDPYLDPEYLRTGRFTKKSDVYCFGVLLVELVSGRQPIEPKKEMKERITARWAMKNLAEGNSILVLDPKLPRNPATIWALEKLLELALQCLAPAGQSRPRIGSFHMELWSIRNEYRELSGMDVRSLSLVSK